jgi:hypothetical protein
MCYKLSILVCYLLEVLMSKLLCRVRITQPSLFPHVPQTPPWQELPREVQQKTLSLLTQLLRRLGPSRSTANRVAEDNHE